MFSQGQLWIWPNTNCLLHKIIFQFKRIYYAVLNMNRVIWKDWMYLIVNKYMLCIDWLICSLWVNFCGCFILLSPLLNHFWEFSFLEFQTDSFFSIFCNILLFFVYVSILFRRKASTTFHQYISLLPSLHYFPLAWVVFLKVFSSERDVFEVFKHEYPFKRHPCTQVHNHSTTEILGWVLHCLECVCDFPMPHGLAIWFAFTH